MAYLMPEFRGGMGSTLRGHHSGGGQHWAGGGHLIWEVTIAVVTKMTIPKQKSYY